MAVKKSSYLKRCLFNYFFVIVCLLISTSCATNTKKQEQVKYYTNNNEYEKALSLIDNKEVREYYNGRLHAIDGKYKEAYEIYYNSIKLLKNSDSERLYKTKSAMLVSICYCLIRADGDYRYVNRLTDYVVKNEKDFDVEMYNLFGKLSDEEQFILLQGLSIVHVFFTSDSKRIFEIFSKCDKLLNNNKNIFLYINPFSYADFKTNQVYIDMFLGYSKLERGNLTEVSSLQKKLENLYDSIPVKFFLNTSEFLGLLKEDRAIILGLGGYGYSILGQYRISDTFFQKSINSFDEKYPENYFNRIILGALHMAYSYSYLLPVGLDKELESHISTGKDILDFKIDKYKRAINFLVDYFYISIDIGLNLMQSKYFFHKKEWDNCFDESSYVINKLDRALPKILTTEALYLAFLSEIKNPVKHNIKQLDDIFRKSVDNLKGYDGYETWKIHYVDSLLKEMKGDADGSLIASKKSVAYLEKFWNDRFLFAQQMTFMEDKNLPYQRTIELLIKRKFEKDKEEIFKYIEMVKSHSVIASQGEDNKISRETPSLREVQRKLLNNEAAIEFYYGKNYLISLFISNSDTVMKKYDYSEDDMNNILGKFIDNIAKNSNRDDADYISSGYDIYARLLKPYNEMLIGKKKIFIVPHRGLHYLPWNALSTDDKNKGDRYLIDEPYTVTVMPSLTAFTFYPHVKERTSSCSSLFIGPHVDDDIRTAEESKKDSCGVYTKEDVSKKRLLDSLKQTKNVILVAHGTPYEKNPFESNIKLYNEELTIKDILDADINSDFVFLSGCGTGYIKRYSDLKLIKKDKNIEKRSGYDEFKDDFLEQDDLLGIYKTFFSKGVNSVAASLISDTDKESNVILAKNIFSELKNNSDTSIAFKKSVLKLREYKPWYSHPYYWGAYMLAGGIKQ